MPYVTIVVGLIGAGSALLGIWLGYHYSQKQFKQQRKDDYVKFLLEKRFKAIEEVFVALVECRDIVNRYANKWDESKGIEGMREEVRKKLDRYIELKNKSAIWINKKIEEKFNFAMGVFRSFSNAFRQKTTPGTINQFVDSDDWKKLSETYNELVEEIRNFLRYQKLEEYFESLDK